jgi:hypothetical protein
MESCLGEIHPIAVEDRETRLVWLLYLAETILG